MSKKEESSEIISSINWKKTPGMNRLYTKTGSAEESEKLIGALCYFAIGNSQEKANLKKVTVLDPDVLLKHFPDTKFNGSSKYLKDLISK